jgi:hypothetical protein
MLVFPARWSDVVAQEFRRFSAASPNAAAEALGVLSHIGVAGLGGLDGGQRDRLGIARPFSWHQDGWMMWFDVDGPWHGPCEVLLLTVGMLTERTAEEAKRAAMSRRP